MAEPQHDSLLEEIEDELRHERYAKLWKAYGHYVICAAVVFVVAVAGYQGWRAYDIQAREAAGEQFAAALTQAKSGDTPGATQVLSRMAADAPGGYALLARFRQAAAAAERDRPAAAGLYRALANDRSVDSLYRDLARVLAGYNDLDTATPDALIQELAPLTANDNPWRHSAREITALLTLRKGDRDAARNLLAALAADFSTPAQMRTRAGEILNSFGPPGAPR
ncbi:MAG: tetratricopeptide repeat protein [Rhodospirillales bacterium]|nr:tetratricopeptide repeat protein [Rhodospirillales bacterium]